MVRLISGHATKDNVPLHSFDLPTFSPSDSALKPRLMVLRTLHDNVWMTIVLYYACILQAQHAIELHQTTFAVTFGWALIWVCLHLTFAPYSGLGLGFKVNHSECVSSLQSKLVPVTNPHRRRYQVIIQLFVARSVGVSKARTVQ